MKEPIYIDRPPRIQPELPFDEVEIPSPPEKEEQGFMRLIQVGLPLITIVGYILMSTMGVGRSPMMMCPMAMSVIASTIFSIYTYRKEIEERAEVERAYTDRLIELNKEMAEHQNQQRRFYRYNYPDRLTTFRIVENAKSEVEKVDRTLRSKSRLWERRRDDEDFGVVRLGMGTLPSTVRYVLGDVEDFDDPQVREAMKLEEDSEYVNDILVIISLRKPLEKERGEDEEKGGEEDENGRTPIIHSLGIAGSRRDVYEYARAMLGHFVVFHAPMDARMYVLATQKQEWAWVEHLPHSNNDEQNNYYCFVGDIKEETKEKAFGDDDEGELDQFLEGVRKTLATRKIRLQDRGDEKSSSDPTHPFLLVVIDLMDDAIYDKKSLEKSPLDDLESKAAISILLEQGAELGAAVIFLVPERSKVPSDCQAVIEIEKTTPATNSKLQQYQKLHFRYAEIGVNSVRYVGESDLISKPETMFALAQKLAELEVRQGYGANLTNTVPFLTLMGYNSLRELEVDSAKNWEASALPQYADWLRVKLGLMSGNQPRTLVFSAKRDGVHGMVAGSTGSGKSELLISLITAMAVTYNPTVLNFVLVDYKGGGAFSGFEELPHCVDIITNLEGEGVTRMFTAINSEMQRRQALNTTTSTKNIVDYRKKGLHIDHAPYPYLFIIIDEFAEMIADRPEYKAELETITRVGRAQGVSLILAAQRPSGVTDQMRSNIKFRICLRVETPGESREMLRRSDAAYLPGDIPGRGYLQVGNEEIEMVQLAYTGEKYIDPDAGIIASVKWPKRDKMYNPDEDQEPPELFRAIVASLDKIASTNGIEKQRAPWPEFLPFKLSLSELLVTQDPKKKAVTSDVYLEGVDQITLGRKRDKLLTLNPSVNQWMNGDNGWLDKHEWEKYGMRPVVGLVDDPYAASQRPLTIHLPRGHVVIFGASGWGKTTFIRSLVVSLTATHSPDHLWVYILDLGGRNLTVLEELPHVGSVIIPDQEGYEERVEQLLRELDDIVEERKGIFGNVGVSDVYKYNNAHPESVLPTILVAIDNFIEFKETFDNGSENVESVLDKFVDLARQAKSYGIHFVVSVNQLNILSNQLFSLFTERITLKLTDQTEYRAIVGGRVADIGDVPGRGYMKIGPVPLSLQIAVPLDAQKKGGDDEASERDGLKQFAQNMRDFIAGSTHKYKEPIRVDALPKSILFRQILARQMDIKFDESFLAELTAVTIQKWNDSLDADLADWLRVTLGVISGNRMRELHFEAKEAGVHGMLAGGTGSGKSEILMTLIVGLALNYDPSILNFVLVDYKGGGAFRPFEKLPHCVDIITNLNPSAVTRMFTAINAEMQRRQKLNADTATKDIVEYRAKGFHLSKEPYPHLFIIIDEYAEMITDNPEFKDELDSITRVGRAQGVNLLLASQRPKGVSDQMRANIKFRICLRVEGVDTSREMLRRNDAAYLPSGMPGRGYLQIGNDNIELMQIAYTGETYPYVEAGEGGRKPKFYDVVVQLANDLLEGERPRTPWPPFLEKKITLSTELVEEYLQQEYIELMTLGQMKRPSTLNPFIKKWFDGTVGWHGMDWNKTAMRAIVGIVDDPYNSSSLPLIVNMTSGHVVLFGASGWGKTTFLRTLIISLAATHSPDEFHAHILDLGGRNLEVLRELPHVGSIIMPDERGYEERVQQLLRELNDIVDERKRLFSESGASTLYEYNRNHPDNVKAAVLVVIDNFAEYIESFGDVSGKKDDDNLLETMVLLIRQAKAYGIHFVITASRLNVLSSKLYSLFTERLTLRLSDTGSYRGVVGGHVAEIEEIPGRGYVKVGRQPLEFQIAVGVGEFDEQGQLQLEKQEIVRLGEMMHKIGTGKWSGNAPLRIDALPKTSSYRQVQSELLNISQEKTFLDEFKNATRKVWHHNALAEEADWLKVVLGISSGNRMRELTFEAKKDGVHGLVAGGTGSGKSELLMTMIVGLALNYDPSILNFVLVDYKGGGAFKPFQNLPHCVDIVTNLNKAAVHRMFASIDAEIRRRQALNAETGTKDIVDYRRKNLHKTYDAYPHLFIIIDEYSEMIDDNPDFKANLDSITRVGRAQGVNLILASQKPKGVTGQMRANIKMRLCLRVEELDTSRELLHRPDAALLPNGLPGRGYLQIGNENLELIQVSWTGENQPDERDVPVIWTKRKKKQTTESSDDPKLYDAVVTMAEELMDGQRVPKPWAGFLPTTFSLQSSLYDSQKNEEFELMTAVTDWLNGDSESLWTGINWRTEAMRPIAGLLDNPAEAWQGPLRFELNRTHLAIMGDSGWGKTSLVRTIITSLAATHSPNEFHAYVLDLGGRNYRSLEGLPHMGGIIYADEETYEERLQRLLDKLNTMAGERQQIFSNADVNNLYEYNEKQPEDTLPAVLVVIDNFAELRENYESLVDATIIPLVRKSLSVGITFVITGNVPNNMPSKLYNLLGERITFQQADKDRYMDIVGRGAIEIDDIAGRGYIRVGRRPLLFHAAQPVGLFAKNGRDDTLNEADELRLMARHMHQHLASGAMEWVNKPDPIATLPEIVPLIDLLQEAEEPKRRIQAVVGRDINLKPALFDLKRMGPHFAVVGPPLSGKSTTLYNWVFSLTHRYSPEKIKLVLVDLQQRFIDFNGKRRLDELPHVVTAVTEIEQIETFVANLKVECHILANEDSDRELFVIIDNFDDFAEELERLRDAARDLAMLTRRYGRDGLHIIVGGMLDSRNDLQRRVQQSNYGIGLRSTQAIDTLRVSRRPAGLRGKALAVGRGFIVKSGIPTMIQAATPYEGMGVQLSGNDVDDDEERNAQALDKWVAHIVKQYPEQQAEWAAIFDADVEIVETAKDSETKPYVDMLRQLICEQSDKEAADVAQWDDAAVIMEFSKDALQKATNLDISMFGDKPKDILDNVIGLLPKLPNKKK